MKKILKMILFLVFLFFLIFFAYFFLGKVKPAEKIIWGLNFSQKHARDLQLDWKENYLALLDDLQVKNLKILTHWDLIELERGRYNFEDLDWQLIEAEKRGAKILLVIGMKTGRWPECHLPGWAKEISKTEQQKSILKLVEKTVLRYRDNVSVEKWQVENEPFFPFGECQWADKEFLKKEINLVKALDARKREILVSDSGEGSFWFSAAELGDIVGTTMYKKVWFRQFKRYIYYPFPPVFYHRKALLIKKLFGKEVIVVELQAEPWGPKLLYDSPPEEQKKTMDLGSFKFNIEFARNTGLKEFYLWGGEWMYWMKTKQGDPLIWDEAKKLWRD